jgi:hypothetical protein
MVDGVKERNEYVTKDFNLAAFLWAQTDVQMKKHHPGVGNSRELFFTFVLPLTTGEIDTLVNEYMNEACFVEPRSFCDAQSKLRQLIHSQ